MYSIFKLIWTWQLYQNHKVTTTTPYKNTFFFSLLKGYHMSLFNDILFHLLASPTKIKVSKSRWLQTHTDSIYHLHDGGHGNKNVSACLWQYKYWWNTGYGQTQQEKPNTSTHRYKHKCWFVMRKMVKHLCRDQFSIFPRCLLACILLVYWLLPYYYLTNY